MGIGSHTDYECLTLLYSTAPGLEVLNSAGTWVDAPPTRALVINIGDMMEIWTSHRVRPVRGGAVFLPPVLRRRLRHQGPTARPLRHRGTAGKGGADGRRALFAQTAQSLNYLKARLTRGEIKLPESYVPLSSFGQEARYGAYDEG
jgi:hypothetical protein